VTLGRSILVGAMALVLLSIGGCYLATGGPTFHLRAIRVRAIDAVTDRPLPGTVVAAQWTTSDFACIEAECLHRSIRTAEAVADANGFADIPPADVPRSGWEILHANQPWILIYKAGYSAQRVDAGTCHLIPPLSEREAVERAQDMTTLFGPLSRGWPRTRFPRLTAEIYKLLPPGISPSKNDRLPHTTK
jgi:hypothetical protein